jgi:hypothetical protein
MDIKNEQAVNGYKIVERDGLIGLQKVDSTTVLEYKYTKITFKKEKLNIYETVKKVEVVGKKKNKKGEEIDDVKEKEVIEKIGEREINIVKCEIITPGSKIKEIYSVENPNKLAFLRGDTMRKAPQKN